ncbi:hypothetical protein [Paludisphaera rhizosphaerae]|uniref:hypothetical protein n=1 Tax=Paludisphaera rhizosphaerae TaxID=2711216 RepID=UPI0013EB2CFF|nr:hypothetical protein [Paludisphaera rhizosphaerae]
MNYREAYRKIRRKNPGRVMGEHWEGVGAYLADGVWADPDWCGLPGELEIFWGFDHLNPSRTG